MSDIQKPPAGLEKAEEDSLMGAVGAVRSYISSAIERQHWTNESLRNSIRKFLRLKFLNITSDGNDRAITNEIKPFAKDPGKMLREFHQLLKVYAGSITKLGEPGVEWIVNQIFTE